MTIGRYPGGVCYREGTETIEEDEMVDPVCGMAVEQSEAAAAWDHEGTTYYFCSVGCFDRFRSDPQGYLDGGSASRGM